MQAGREIKFRYVFKHPKTKEVQTAIITIDDMERNDWSKTFKWDSLRFELVARQRYTGLRDKNGKEIYEGDIVRLEDCGDIFDHIVKWIPEEARFVFETTEDWYGPEEMDFDFCKVIGNVYENWDLVPG